MPVGTPKLHDPKTIRQVIQRLALQTHESAAPTFAGLVLSDLTASRLVSANASKALASVSNLANWVAGTDNEITIIDDTDGTLTISLANIINLGNSA